jgi:hypothetical protein
MPRAGRRVALGDAATPQSRFAANNPAHPGIMAQTFGVVLIYVL